MYDSIKAKGGHEGTLTGDLSVCYSAFGTPWLSLLAMISSRVQVCKLQVDRD